MSQVLSVNVGQAQPKPHRPNGVTGIGKRAVDHPVEVRPPGPKRGSGSGLAGDFIGNRKYHGGDDQAVYAVAREDLDRWSIRLERDLPNGFFGENLTTVGIDPNEARIGEVWRIGDTVELTVTHPRTPCATFQGWVGERQWTKQFTADARPGAYFRVTVPGLIAPGDAIEVTSRPEHDVTISTVFLALMTERHLLPSLVVAEPHLTDEVREAVSAWLVRAAS